MGTSLLSGRTPRSFLVTLGMLAALAAIAAGGACSVEAVKFSPPTDAPLADAPVTDAAPDATPDAQPDAPLPLVENCAVVGDEDGNGTADCRDPACVAGVSTCAESAACNTDCSISRCGDNKRNMAAGEACDLGTADTATCDGDCTLPACNDGRLNTLAGEERDPPTSPVSTVPINPTTCRFDFSGITQLYCDGSCSWAGMTGCDQQDANAFCRLKTGNPAATAAAPSVMATAATAGICCPTQMVPGCVLLGRLPGRGVALNIYVHNTDLAGSHSGGQVIRNPTCLVP